MAFIPSTRSTKSSMVYDLSGQRAINNLHFIWPTAEATSADRDALNLALKTWFDTYGKVHLGTQVSLVQIDTINLLTAADPGSILIVSPGIQGSLSNAGPMPNNASIVMTKRTAQRGRSFRGRTYLPGIANESAGSPTAISASRVAQLVSDFTQLVTSPGVSAVLSVLSYFIAGAARGSAVRTPVTAISADNYLDSQRRRLFGRGT